MEAPPRLLLTTSLSDAFVRNRAGNVLGGTGPEVNEVIHVTFPNRVELRSEIIDAHPGETFAVEYFNGTASFELTPDGGGGTDLTLRHDGPHTADNHDTAAGWVSVLPSVKAAIDHSIDRRTRDPNRTWDEGHVDN